MLYINLIKDIRDNLSSIPINEGNLIVCTDTKEVFYDNKDGKRTMVSCVFCENESVRISIKNDKRRYDTLYFVEQTDKLYIMDIDTKFFKEVKLVEEIGHIIGEFIDLRPGFLHDPLKYYAPYVMSSSVFMDDSMESTDGPFTLQDYLNQGRLSVDGYGSQTRFVVRELDIERDTDYLIIPYPMANYRASGFNFILFRNGLLVDQDEYEVDEDRLRMIDPEDHFDAGDRITFIFVYSVITNPTKNMEIDGSMVLKATITEDKIKFTSVECSCPSGNDIYNVSRENIDEYYEGLKLIIYFKDRNTTTTPKINVNNLGDVVLKKNREKVPIGLLYGEVSLLYTNNSFEILSVADAQAVYNVAKRDSTKYMAVYRLQKDGTDIGEPINIPKVISSGSLEYCKTAGVPIKELKVGDPYIDLKIDNENHIYVPASALVDQITHEITGSGNSITDVACENNHLIFKKNATFVPQSRKIAGVSLDKDVTSEVLVSAIGSTMQSNWSQTDSTKADFIKNKPTSMKNPYSLTIGKATYDGSAAKTLTADDIKSLMTHTAVVKETDTSSNQTLNYSDSFTVIEDIVRDDFLHTTKVIKKKFTLPTKESVMTGATASAAGKSGFVPAPAAGKQLSFLRGDGTWVVPTDTKYSAGTGLSLSGTTFNHSNSITAGTAKGDDSKTLGFGGTFTIPTVTYDAQGHITGKGTTTMTMPANPNTDTKVTQTVTTSNAAYPLLLAPSGQTTTVTTTSYFDSGVTLNPSTNTIAANISGNSATATKATQDSAGQNINTTYIKGLSINGKVITYTKGDGTTGTITTQDTVYTHPTSSGNKHIPSGGSSGQILRWSADGTAAWGADNNTTYSAGTGLTLSGTTFNHTNSVTAGTAQGDASKTLTYGGTFTIPSLTFDAQGHITAKGSTTMTMPAAPKVLTIGTATYDGSSAVTVTADHIKSLMTHTAVTKEEDITNNVTLSSGDTFTVIEDITRDSFLHTTKVTKKSFTLPSSAPIGSSDTSSKIFLMGATAQSASTDKAYTHDTAYIGTDGCVYSGGQKTLVLHSTGNMNGYFYTGTTTPTGTARLNYSGYFYATRVYNAVYNDYAELFLKDNPEEEFKAGDVVVKVKGKNTYTKCSKYCDNLVVGVVSENYGHLLGGTGNEEYDKKHYVAIGLAGVIPVNIDCVFEEGDLLTTSSVSGYACVSQTHKPGTIIGKVLQKIEDNRALMLIMNC